MSFPDGELRGSEFVAALCPVCGKENHLYFNVDKAAGKCQYGGCSLNSGFGGWKKFYALFNLEEGEAPKKEATPGTSWRVNEELADTSRISLHAWDDKFARGYLESRGIAERACREIPILWHTPRQALVIATEPVSPEYPNSSVFREIHYSRSKWMPARADANKYIFGGKFWRAKHKRGTGNLIVTEGIFDIITPGMLGDAVALLGSKMSSSVAVYIKNMLSPKNVYLWLDPDTAGEVGSKKAQETLLRVGVNSAIITSTLEPKEVDPEELQEFLKGLEEVNE